MALSEGLNKFVEFFMGKEEDPFVDLGNEVSGDSGSYETDGSVAIDKMFSPKTSVKPAHSFEKESKVVSIPNSYKTGEVAVIEPRSFSESAQIVKRLLDKKTVILHLDLLDKEQSQRTIDFVCGAAHALNGTAQKISDSVFLFTPSNISLSVENSNVQNKFAEALWNKPL